MKFKSLMFLSAICGIFFLSSLWAQDGFQYYYQAKKLMHQREYKKALDLFDKLKKEFPGSKYEDDAEFWSAYIMERENRYDESFQRYNRLKEKYPKSPWVDDAEVQQIGIAERLANRGKRKYLNYLVDRVHSRDKTIKYQASLSLGKLNDQRALPGLRQIANNGDKDMSQIARSLIKTIESDRVKHPERNQIKNRLPLRDGKKYEKIPMKRPQSRLKNPPRAPRIQHPGSGQSKSGRTGSGNSGKKTSSPKGKS
ncbi:MAG: tetratricopeptide repeat protein [Calditrichaeota bacterium]|nr:tetratricopeptide repeat protein [Calditrichota bacterium]